MTNNDCKMLKNAKNINVCVVKNINSVKDYHYIKKHVRLQKSC